MLKKFAIQIRAPARRVPGFSLIELMISIVIGMLVIAGATTLIVAINGANAATIQSARLTQELRATLEVIAADLRRARRLDDPIGVIGKGALAKANGTTFTGPYDSIAASAAQDCITYGYQGTENNSATDTTRAVKNYRAIYRFADAAGMGSVVLVSDPLSANVTCTAVGTTLSSTQIDITALTFAPSPVVPVPVPAPTVNDGTIVITLSGKLRFQSGANLKVARTLTQTVNVRSPKAG